MKFLTGGLGGLVVSGMLMLKIGLRKSIIEFSVIKLVDKIPRKCINKAIW